MMEIEMKHVIFLFTLCYCLICLSGCGEKYPADFPKVYPVTVTVTDGTTPIPNARIIFYRISKETDAGYISSGYTDEKGVAKVTTTQGSYTKAGIPVGEYVVAVDEVIKIDLGVPPGTNLSFAEESRLAREETRLRAEFKSKVPAVLAKLTGKVEDRSPLRYTATAGKNELAIDVAQYQ